AGAWLLGGAAVAAEVEGVKLADKVRLGDGGPELVLNGAGLRTRVFFKVYVGALYLREKSGSAQAVFADNGPKRVAMHMLRDLTADQLFSAFNDGLKANHAPAEVAKLEPQVKQLEGIFSAVKAAKSGDTILLDYVPGAGTRVVVNGNARGTIAGEEFNRALLRIWLGDQPVDAALKKAMLGG
ncbi:MAG TPA: chalcone isomerase family protein, partial [Burkholderiales bacterium]|nr:chalcone isomerase family protein [Burkholderiales bacterium]